MSPRTPHALTLVLALATLPLSAATETREVPIAFKQEGARLTARVTELAFRGEGEAAFRSDDDVLVAAVSNAGEDSRLVLRIAPAGRIIAGGPNGTAVLLRRGQLRGARALTSGALAVQDASSQHGLTVSGDGEPMRVTVRGTKAGFELQLVPPSANANITVRGFRGDALLAMEQASPAGDLQQTPSVTGVAELTPAPQSPRPQAAAGAPDEVAAPARRERRRTGWLYFTGADRAFKPLRADPREAAARIMYMYNCAESDNLMDAVLGGDLVLAEYNWADARRLTISARGLFTARLNTCESSFPLLNSDYFGGVAVGYRDGDDELEAFLFHESSHLGDEILEEGRRERIDFSREAIRLLWSHRFGKLRVYGGPTWSFRAYPESDVENTVVLQAGAEWLFKVSGVPMYAAGNAASRQWNDWDVNFTGQVGVLLGDKEDHPNGRPRVFLEYFNGFSNMGQFWDEREQTIGVGLGYNF